MDVFRPAGPSADARAFSAAGVVLAPHGAGLANMVACPPWAHVLELLAQPVNIMCGFIAVRLGLSLHAFVFCEATAFRWLLQPVNVVLGIVAPWLGSPWRESKLLGATHGEAMHADVTAVVARVEAAAAMIAATAAQVEQIFS